MTRERGTVLGFARAFKRDRSGAVAVEFALVMPVFLLMVMGVVSVGLYIAVAHNLTQIAAQAARTAVGGLSAAERAQLATASASQLADGYAFIDPGRVSVAAVPDPTDADLLTVTVSYDTQQLPMFSWLRRFGLSGNSITASSVVRSGGF